VRLSITGRIAILFAAISRSHTIHHDVTNLIRENQELGLEAVVLSLLLGGKSATVRTAINLAANLQSLSFSRDVERAADLKGAETCARSGINPWGMLWLLRQFEKADSGNRMEMLSDHPTNERRISDLETHFSQNPPLFAHFRSDAKLATRLLPRAASGSSKGAS
jgi:predicted Zn-dependent protease